MFRIITPAGERRNPAQRMARGQATGPPPDYAQGALIWPPTFGRENYAPHALATLASSGQRILFESRGILGKAGSTPSIGSPASAVVMAASDRTPATALSAGVQLGAGAGVATGAGWGVHLTRRPRRARHVGPEVDQNRATHARRG